VARAGLSCALLFFLSIDILSLLAAGVEAAAAAAAAAAALRAARAQLSTRRMAMPCLPPRTNFVDEAAVPLNLAKRLVAPKEARRATAPSIVAAVVIAAPRCCGRRLRARIRVLFLNLTCLLRGACRERPAAEE
ncbi:unnamed protein product, partial [Ectocarpus sp. 12 AP-2014]